MVRVNMPGPLPQVWLNGEFCPLDEAKVPVLDRGFLFGDGVYELLPVYSRVPLRPDAHLQRLARSLAETGIADPFDQPGWLALVESLVEANDTDNVSVYIQVTRGAPAHRDHAFPPAALPPTVFAMCAPLPTLSPTLLNDGAAAILQPDTRWARCDIKATSLLANVLLRQSAVESGAAESILVSDGYVTEGSASSVFAVFGDAVLTPPDSPAVLPGTTRDLVLELAAADGIDARFEALPQHRFRHADEIWVCSSVREVLPVTTLDGEPIGDGRPGPMWRRVYDLFQRYKREALERAA